MRKNGLIFILLMVVIFVLAACGSTKPNQVNVFDYVEIDYEGLDSQGDASYTVDDEALGYAVVGAEDEEDYEAFLEKMHKKDIDTYHAIIDLSSNYKLSLDKDSDLSNGDKITMSLELNDRVKEMLEDGEQEYTVEGLEEPEQITADEVEKHIVTYFAGADGKGYAQTENTFKDELNELIFTVENNGELSNGDKVGLTLDEESKEPIDMGYKLEDDFNVEVEVKDLVTFPEKATDIKNFKDVKRMVKERAEELYEDQINIEYTIKQEVLLYRQFDDEMEVGTDINGVLSADVKTSGSLIALYSVEEYDSFTEKTEKFIAPVGFSNLQVDKDNKVNVSELEDIGSRYGGGDERSLDTVQQIYEGEGYEVVKE